MSDFYSWQVGDVKKKRYFSMNIRLLLSVLLDIKLQEKMMGALGVRNKVRSFILHSNSFTSGGPVISLFSLPKLNALKHFPPPLPPSSSSRLTTYPSSSANKGVKCPKFSPIYLPPNLLYLYIQTYIHKKYLSILPCHLRIKVFSLFL